jgi:hypothetical protein
VELLDVPPLDIPLNALGSIIHAVDRPRGQQHPFNFVLIVPEAHDADVEDSVSWQCGTVARLQHPRAAPGEVQVRRAPSAAQLPHHITTSRCTLIALDCSKARNLIGARRIRRRRYQI